MSIAPAYHFSDVPGTKPPDDSRAIARAESVEARRRMESRADVLIDTTLEAVNRGAIAASLLDDFGNEGISALARMNCKAQLLRVGIDAARLAKGGDAKSGPIINVNFALPSPESDPAIEAAFEDVTHLDTSPRQLDGAESGPRMPATGKTQGEPTPDTPEIPRPILGPENGKVPREPRP